MGDEQVRRLLEAGAKINEIDEEGRTPLLRACAAGNAEVVKLLLERGGARDLPSDAQSAEYDKTIVALLEEARKKKKQAFPPEFTKVTVLCLSEELDDGGRRWLEEKTKQKNWTSGSRWNSKKWREYTAEEWGILVRGWENDYPTREWHAYETDYYRGRQTNERGNIEYCWIETGEQLSSELKGLLGQKYADLFRVDRYGNVIANRLSDLSNKDSITFFDVDHIFAWSRGGRSVRNNFVACQYAANRDAKRAKLLCTLTKEEMQRGISVKQFEALLKYCSEKEGGKRAGNNVANNRQQVVAWLTMTPRKSQGISNFQASTADLVKDGEPDGEALWNFLENYFRNASTATVLVPRDEGTNATPRATPRAAPRKPCPECKTQVAARTKQCKCGHVFVSQKERDAAAAKERDEELALLRAALAARDKENALLRAEAVSLLVARDAEIASLRAAFAAQDRELAERDLEVESMRAALEAKGTSDAPALVSPSKS